MKPTLYILGLLAFNSCNQASVVMSFIQSFIHLQDHSWTKGSSNSGRTPQLIDNV